MNALRESIAALPAGALWVGFSGGMDSMVLLHQLAALPEARTRGLVALHVCHGLHPDADDWAAHCARFAESLRVPFQRTDVSVLNIEEGGLEAAARRARHAAFARLLPSPGVLALAHHRDDQTETLLLRLLHGAGHEGLAGMRSLRILQRGDATRWLWRPLLDCPRSGLAAHAAAHALPFIDDPANADSRYTRNRLRHAVIPAMESAFPGASARIAAAAQRLRDEADALDAIALDVLARHRGDDRSLHCAALRDTPPAMARRVVGAWLDGEGLPRPPPGVWSQLVVALVDARPDAIPVLEWRGARLRRHRDRLYADAGHPVPTGHWSLTWDGTTPLVLPDGLGTLAFDPALRQPHAFTVRPRLGGETLRLRGRQRRVKQILQESDVPPWKRDRLPLVFTDDGALVSIAGRWNDDAFSRWISDQGSRFSLRHD
ncbi:tRNA lysidine(34) synthetase TilS [Xanthomonadaceae bacterium JHOS43]|nr:tRNA lysidine(34) synthetase TilS [Xanthomonadaceae bacterium JHOS43]